MTFALRHWTTVPAEERADVIEHLEAEGDALLDGGEGRLGRLFRSAASVLQDVVHLPELVEGPPGKAPESATATDRTPRRRKRA